MGKQQVSAVKGKGRACLKLSRGPSPLPMPLPAPRFAPSPSCSQLLSLSSPTHNTIHHQLVVGCPASDSGWNGG